MIRYCAPQVNSTVSSAIPILSDAVSNIIRHSSNKHFQQSCLNTLNSNSLEEIDVSIESKLKCLANKKLSVGDGGSDLKCPQVRGKNCNSINCHIRDG